MVMGSLPSVPSAKALTLKVKNELTNGMHLHLCCSRYTTNAYDDDEQSL